MGIRRIDMKKTCSGCRALNLELCDLGYKTEMRYRRNRIVRELVPLEDCPKPTKYEDFALLYDALHQQGIRLEEG